MYQIGDIVRVEGTGEITEISQGEFWNSETKLNEKKVIYQVMFTYSAGYKGHARVVVDLIAPIE